MSVPLRILITGGNGFVGRALCEYLLPQGRITALVRSQGGVEDLLRLGVEVQRGALDPDSSLPESVLAVDVVVHLAARVHVMTADTSVQLQHEQVNHLATLNLARQAAAAGVKRFIYLSSIKVNGERTCGAPFTAADQPQPQDSYARSKLNAEQGLLQLAHASGMEVVIIRPPLIYGPGVKANFSQLLRWIKRGIPLPLGGIDNRRALVSVTNVCDLIRCCLQHPAAAGRVWLVSDGEAVSTPTLCRRIAASMNRKAILISLSPWILKRVAALVGKAEAVARLCEDLDVDISPTCRILQWYPVETMAVALDRMTTAHD